MYNVTSQSTISLTHLQWSKTKDTWESTSLRCIAKKFNQIENWAQGHCCNYCMLAEDLMKEVAAWCRCSNNGDGLQQATFSLHYCTADWTCTCITAFQFKQALAIHLQIGYICQCYKVLLWQKRASRRKKEKCKKSDNQMMVTALLW